MWYIASSGLVATSLRSGNDPIAGEWWIDAFLNKDAHSDLPYALFNLSRTCVVEPCLLDQVNSALWKARSSGQYVLKILLKYLVLFQLICSPPNFSACEEIVPKSPKHKIGRVRLEIILLKYSQNSHLLCWSGSP